MTIILKKKERNINYRIYIGNCWIRVFVLSIVKIYHRAVGSALAPAQVPLFVGFICGLALGGSCAGVCASKGFLCGWVGIAEVWRREHFFIGGEIKGNWSCMPHSRRLPPFRLRYGGVLAGRNASGLRLRFGIWDCEKCFGQGDRMARYVPEGIVGAFAGDKYFSWK